MKHELKKIEKSAFEVKISLTKEEYSPILDKIISKYSESVEIPGFRKGKAPKDAVLTNYKSQIEEELIGEVLNNKFPEVIKEEKISPVSYAQVKEHKLEDNSFEVLFNIDVYPEFEVANYKGLEAEKSKIEVTDEMVNNEIEFMITRASKLEEITDENHLSEMGDTLDIDFEGFIDGVPFEGGKAEHHSLELGSKSFIDNFEDQLVGYKKGSDVEVNVTFPAEYHSKDLAGKPALFKVRINAIKKFVKPELNDEFAKIQGFDSLEAFKIAKKEELIANEEKRAENAYTGKLLEQLIEKTDISVPKSMVMVEVEQQLRQFEYQLSMQGIKFEDYLKMTGGKIEDLIEQVYPTAENKVKVDLILAKIAQNENFEVSDEELNSKMEEIAKMYGMDMAALEAELNKNNNLDNFKASVKSDLLMSKSVELIKSSAK